METKPFADLSVVAILERTDDPSGFYRGVGPLQCLAEGGAHVAYVPITLTAQGYAPAVDTRGERADGILCNRTLFENAPTFLRDLQRRWGCGLVYDCDDLLGPALLPEFFGSKIPPAYLRRWHLIAATIDGVARLAHGVTSPNPLLLYTLAAETPRGVHLPNMIDFHERPWGATFPRDPRLAGGLVLGSTRKTAFDDAGFGPPFRALGEVLGRVLRRYPHVALALVTNDGADPPPGFLKRYGIPPAQFVTLPPCPFPQLPSLYGQFDISLAPLTDSRFNRHKSDLKLRESAASGLPYIASKVGPYPRFHEESGGVGGFLASSEEEWETALCRLIEDQDERETRGAAGEAYVRRCCGMRENAWRWAEVLRAARDRARATADGGAGTGAPGRAAAGKLGRNDSCPCGSGTKYKRCCSPAFG